MIMKKIILDTNFLMAVGQFRFDMFSELRRVCDFKYSIYVLDKTVDELNKIIKEQKGKNKESAKLALKLIKLKKIKKIKTGEGQVDDILLQQDAVIATQDKILVKRLKGNRKKVVQLRQKRYLVIK